MKYNYIIYHKNCFDGFTSLIIFIKSNNYEKKTYNISGCTFFK